uniref:MADF domain-containing protein n=1 Tax=Glossina morsitans morsitans TaxID=37546 RepID=A0A1B0FGC5_GLOMM
MDEEKCIVEFDDEKFIQLVQEYEYLFNKHHPFFKVPHRKETAWRKIAEEMGISDKICIRRWATLRDRYVKLKRKLRSLPADETLQDIPWPLLDSMEFLAPHIVPRPRYSYDIMSVDFKPTTIPFADEPSMSDTFPKFAESSPLQSPIEQVEPSERKKKIKPEKERIDMVVIDPIDSPKKEWEIKSPVLRGFGQMILSLMSEMDQRKQIMAMKAITDIVTKIMLEPEEAMENDFFEITE